MHLEPGAGRPAGPGPQAHQGDPEILAGPRATPLRGLRGQAGDERRYACRKSLGGCGKVSCLAEPGTRFTGCAASLTGSGNRCGAFAGSPVPVLARNGPGGGVTAPADELRISRFGNAVLALDARVLQLAAFAVARVPSLLPVGLHRDTYGASP
jgi:hypothetical protein